MLSADADLYHPLYFVLAVALALACAHLLARVLPPAAASHRFVPLDGLRGFAALFVCLHHASIWSVYAPTGVWALPASRLYIQLGQGAVTLFFLLSSFLFWTKLFERPQRTPWRGFLWGRFLRITPLYVASMSAVALIAYLTTPARHPWQHITGQQLVSLLSFTAIPLQNLFGLPQSGLINAGVTWTLPYEWWLYLALPVVVTLARGRRASQALALAGVLGLYALKQAVSLHPHLLLIFVFGILTSRALASRFGERIRAFATHRWMHFAIPLLSVVLVFGNDTAYRPQALLLYALIFLLVSAGNTVFGLLSSRAARVLGEISYSVYLLQGLVFYLAFSGAIGPRLGSLPVPEYWMRADACLVALLILSAFSYRFIERPWMRRASGPAALDPALPAPP